MEQLKLWFKFVAPIWLGVFGTMFLLNVKMKIELLPIFIVVTFFFNLLTYYIAAEVIVFRHEVAMRNKKAMEAINKILLNPEKNPGKKAQAKAAEKKKPKKARR